MSDPKQPPAVPAPAATVILVRERAPGGEVEVFMLRRHRKASFMSDAFVFPGGRIEPEDGGAGVAAIRELFEEAGVLLALGPALPAGRRAAWRAKLNAGEAMLSDLLREEGLEPDIGRLHYWARWITPAVEPKRFDATFYLAELPPGQTPSFDAQETVDEAWLTPAEALERHAATGFRLFPPQVRTLGELAGVAGGIAGLVAAAAERRRHPWPIMPRFAQVGGTIALLLPWDSEYETVGVGEGITMPPGHFLATGKTRFVLDGMVWRMETR